MIGLPNYLATKQDFENAFANCQTVGEMQILKQKFEGIKAQNKIKVLKESAIAKAKKSEDNKEVSGVSPDDFEEIDAPISVEEKYGIKVVEIDALIEKLNKKISEASK